MRCPAGAIGVDVRFGSKADVTVSPLDVRFTPESGHLQCTSPCPLSARSGHSRTHSIISSARAMRVGGTTPIKGELILVCRNRLSAIFTPNIFSEYFLAKIERIERITLVHRNKGLDLTISTFVGTANDAELEPWSRSARASKDRRHRR
jgi:hypothetical protein